MVQEPEQLPCILVGMDLTGPDLDDWDVRVLVLTTGFGQRVCMP